MTKSDQEYEETFKDIYMHYVVVMLDENGKKVAVRNDADLEKLFKVYDKQHSQDTGKRQNFSESFLEKLKDTRGWKNRLGGIAGHFGKVQTFKSGNAQVTLQASQKKQDLRSQGIASYRYHGGYARKSSYHRGERLIITFRDVVTGKFVKKDSITEEE